MSMLPFDPARAAGAAPATTSVESRRDAAGSPPYSVSQAAELIKNTLERHTPFPLRVVGQVSNLSAREHWYFSLKDQHAVLNCVAWATSARRFKFQPRDGDEVVATGNLSFYAPQGRAQLYVSDLAPVGAGALEIRFRALCEELRQLGYFDDARKRALPLLPRRIAVVTSAKSAASQDVITTAAQRCKAVGLLIVDVRVQGDGSVQEVAHALRWINLQRDRLKVDAILLTRGGGSIEDLWTFNERIVADAIFRSDLPVVAAIGHESDTTIAELVADVRASTPTQAAMRLVPSMDELCRHMEHVSHRIRTLVARGIERRHERARRGENDLRRIIVNRFAHERARLERFSGRLAKLQPQRVLLEREGRLRVMVERLHRSMARRIDLRQPLRAMERSLLSAARSHVHRLRERLGGMQRQLAAIDPQGVLRRGYSITQHADGRLIKSAGEVAPGNGIVTRVADGAFESTVSGTCGTTPRTHARKRPGSSGQGSSQFDLFAPAE